MSRPAESMSPTDLQARVRAISWYPTNWWGPNVPALQAMLRSVGFVEVLVVTPQRSTAYRALRALHHRLQGRNALGPAYRQDRAVCHAFK